MLNNQRDIEQSIKEIAFSYLGLTDEVLNFFYDYDIKTTIHVVKYECTGHRKVFLLDSCNNLLAETILFDHEIRKYEKKFNYMDDSGFDYLMRSQMGIKQYKATKLVSGL